MIDHKVHTIVQSLSQAHGKHFFNTIIEALAKVIDADHTYVAVLDKHYTKATTIAYARGTELADNFSYDIADTPCADVCDNSVCLHNGGAQALYPNDQLLVEMGIDAYVGTPLTDNQGQVLGILVALYRQEIHQVHSTEALFLLFSGLIAGELERRQRQRKLNIHQIMVDAMGEGVLLTNEHQEILYTNTAFSHISGYSQAEALGGKPGELLSSGLHSQAFYQSMWADLEEKHYWSGEIINRKKSGETYPQWLTLHQFTEPESDNRYFLGIFYDLSELKQAQQQIHLRENYDLLTNLPNRQLLLDTIEQQMIISRQHQTQAALLHISLDDFRTINSSLGVKSGDRLLQQIAQRLTQQFQQPATVARIGGDEFALLFPLVGNTRHPGNLAMTVLETIQSPLQIQTQELQITASIGIALFPDDASTAADLVTKAEQASSQAKRQGKNEFQFFTWAMQQQSNRKLALKNALSRALQQRQLQVHFQPLISLHSNQVEKCEALVRWQLDGKQVSPEEFIAIAEEFRLAKSLGRFVLQESCRLVRQLDALGLPPIHIAVNRSIAEFPDTDASQDDWLSQISAENIEHSRIEFEITESLLAPEHRNIANYLHRLKQAGCRVLLDDFGTGYSSLSYLRNFPVDYLKIDRSFIKDIEKDANALTLVSSIVAMSRALGVNTVAEGVENQQQLELLRGLGCDLAQGYYFSRPVPASSLIEFLQHARA